MENSLKPVDSHFHVQIMAQEGFDYKEALQSLSGGIDAGCTASDLDERHPLLKDFPHIRIAAAMGPWETQNRNEHQLEQQFEILAEKINFHKPDFIGETGLDLHWKEYGTIEIQTWLFEKHLELAEQSDRCVIIHCREAGPLCADILKGHENKLSGGIIHCFDGDEPLLRTALDCGFMISFAGNLTYKNNTLLRDSLKKIPKERILLETDSPYLTPVPHRGERNSPLLILHTYLCAAETLGMQPDDLTALVNTNFRAFCTHGTH